MWGVVWGEVTGSSAHSRLMRLNIANNSSSGGGCRSEQLSHNNRLRPDTLLQSQVFVPTDKHSESSLSSTSIFRICTKKTIISSRMRYTLLLSSYQSLLLLIDLIDLMQFINLNWDRVWKQLSLVSYFFVCWNQALLNYANDLRKSLKYKIQEHHSQS